VAHEINTPLAIIGMRIEQMEECISDGEPDGIDFMDGLKVIKQTTDRIAKIVSGLRFFAREGRRAEPQKMKASTIVEETLALCQERFANHGVQLEINKDAVYNSVEFECRSVEISQVILNLLNNAFDAIEAMREKWIKLDVSEIADCVQISVTDCGPGIPKHVQDKIMQPFFTTKPIGKGTGLGLSISKGIIEDHHGKFYIDNSSPNTKFVILLPKSQPVQIAKGCAA
jgi:C4-dicarboxylate-specific signal transduction histidine kinase